MNGYSSISVIPLLCYLFLFMTFAVAKKTKKVIYTFMSLMVMMILWTGGSFAMRMQLWPSVDFWSNLSVFGILMLPAFYYNFVLDFLEERRSCGRYFWLAVFLVLNVFNCFTSLFIPPPEVLSHGGRTDFIYHYSWQVYIVFVLAAVCLIQLGLLIRRYCKGNSTVFRQLLPVAFGMVVLFAGHIISTLPFFSGFPLDIISGVVNAVLLFYALYKKRLFQLTMLFSRGNCYIIALILGVTIAYYSVPSVQRFLMNTVGVGHVHSIILISLIFMLLIVLLYTMINAFFNAVFVRNEQQQGELVARFSKEITRLLKVGDVLQNLTDIIGEALGVYRVFVLVRTEKGDYQIAHTASPLEEKRFSLPEDHPLVTYFSSHGNCVLLREFARTTAYRGMWESEKQMFAGLEIECFTPLICENELLGLVMLGKKKDKSAYRVSDLNFLQSLSAVCAIAVKNSCLYERALEEARRDELTGLISRKYFYEVLQREFDRNGSLALSIINLDDFKLYNQLYGAQEGDIALKRVAAVLAASVDEGCYAARLGGKEFALVLPGYDIYTAKTLTETVAARIGALNSHTDQRVLSRLTVSAGVCAAPYMASSPKELIKNADIAVYSVKRAGKNGVLMYSEEVYRRETQKVEHKSGYGEHASTIYALTAAIDTKDHYTFQHSQNVAYYASELAKGVGLEPHVVEIIKEAGLLHDIGKIGIREDILNKTGPLDSEDWKIMRGHVDNAVNIIRHLPSLDYTIPAVLSHHERYDGMGYPRKLAGEEIPLTGRVLCVADAFDAMTSSRSYKDPIPVARALEILEKEAGKQFDPNLVKVFVELVRSGKIKLRTHQEEGDKAAAEALAAVGGETGER